MSSCLVCNAEHAHKHHALPKSVWPEHRDNPANLIPLCFRCHNDWHAGLDAVTWDVLPDVTRILLRGVASPRWLDRWYPTREGELPF